MYACSYQTCNKKTNNPKKPRKQNQQHIYKKVMKRNPRRLLRSKISHRASFIGTGKEKRKNTKNANQNT